MQGNYGKYKNFPLFSTIRGFLRFTLARAFTPSVCPVALLIDGDNHAGMSSELLAQILIEAGKLGGVIIRKVYGNWREPTMDKWKDLCIHYGLEQVYYSQNTTAGKNGADIALALEALDLYRCNGITHFCLVASDSDYLPLLRRLRANGCVVVVIGKATALPVLMKASTVFIDLEHLVFHPSKSVKADAQQLVPPTQIDAVSSTATIVSTNTTATQIISKVDTTSLPQKLDAQQLITLLLKAYEQAAKEKTDGWVSIPKLQAVIIKLDPSFKVKNTHYKKFSSLIQAHQDIFEMRKQSSGQLEICKKQKS